MCHGSDDATVVARLGAAGAIIFAKVTLSDWFGVSTPGGSTLKGQVRNPYDPTANIGAGVKHLKGLIDRMDGAIDMALEISRPNITAAGHNLSGDGSCGDLMDALMYEKRIETHGVEAIIPFADWRGWGMMPQGTICQFAPPGRELELIGPQGVLVNTSRGPVVDEEALADALSEGRIFAAGLEFRPMRPDVPPADPAPVGRGGGSEICAMSLSTSRDRG